MNVVDITVLQYAAEQVTEEVVGDKEQHHQHESCSGGAPGDFHCQHHHQDAKSQIPYTQGAEERNAVDDLACVDGKVNAGGKACPGKEVVRQGWVLRIGLGGCAYSNKRDGHHPAKKDGHQRPWSDDQYRCRNNDVNGKGHSKRCNGSGKPTLRPAAYTDGKPQGRV